MAKGRPKKCEILVINNVARWASSASPASSYSVLKEAKDPAGHHRPLAGPA